MFIIPYNHEQNMYVYIIIHIGIMDIEWGKSDLRNMGTSRFAQN